MNSYLQKQIGSQATQSTTQKCWDPADLLQITQGSPSIRCVGRYVSYPGGPCMRSSRPQRSARSAARDASTLLQSQKTDVVRKWTRIIESAARHHQNLSRFSANAMQLNLAQCLVYDLRQRLDTADLFAQSARAQNSVLGGQVRSWEQKYETLQKDLKTREASARKSVTKVTSEFKVLEAKLSSTANDLKNVQVVNADQGFTIASLTTTKKTLEITVHQSATQIKHLETDKSEARNKIELLQTEINSLREQRKISAQSFEKLQVDFNNLEGRSRIMQDELHHKEATLKTYESSLDQAQRHIQHLELKIFELRDVESSLKRSIAACWFHWISDWLNGSLKSFWQRDDVSAGLEADLK
ncbi:hypothetical protein FSARC_8489 [Fusarium sarcochroum]|uniref:Uncharacterized protein n=1 Tax=Fusarium sarcochroum TaxID=1208366 RepID=A0A8H4TT00_9HYPO|nr:hypothetical protein FSARC_8489 [Fusarium sarcochroum]